MQRTRFSDEAEFVYSIFVKHFKESGEIKGSIMIELDDYLPILKDDSLMSSALEELEENDLVSNVKSFIDGSFYVTLRLNCRKMLEAGKEKLNESSETAKSHNFTSKELLVAAYYPQFEKDYDLLLSNGFMIKNGDGLKWIKSKQSLAEYFSSQKEIGSTWKDIENLFDEKGLGHLVSVAEYKSKDFKELQKILKKS